MPHTHGPLNNIQVGLPVNGLRGFPSAEWEWALPRDESGIAVPGDVVPRPLDEHEHLALELDEIHEVHDEPRHPCTLSDGYGGCVLDDELAGNEHPPLR